MDAAEALADLKQISVQIVHAVVCDHDGAVEASTLPDVAAAERMARSGLELWEAADRARRDLGRDALAQLEAATADGSVFLARDESRAIAATTGRDPTVGLIFYDLKTALRSLAAPAAVAASEPAIAWEDQRAAARDAAAAEGAAVEAVDGEGDEDGKA